MQNLAGFIFPHTDTPKTHPVLDPNLQRGFFRGVCFCAPTRVREKFGGFHIPAHGCAKNTPDFTLPNKDTPKPHPILDPNLRRGTFRGVCFCAPTRVRAKPARFHISAPGYVKNLPDFTFSNRDTPKNHPVLGANPCRRIFRGVCNTPLHGYVQNPAGFIFPHMYPPKTRPVSYFRTRIHQKRTRFHISPSGYTKNPSGFRPKPSARDFSGRMQYAPTRVRTKFGGFWTLPLDMARNPAGFGLCHTT